MTHSKQENTWRGDFGNEYTKRNEFDKQHIENCCNVFRKIFSSLPNDANLSDILEIGCNSGRNLEALNKLIPTANLYGVEPNASARNSLLDKQFVNSENIKDSLGSSIPFASQEMSMVFTSVVLIHVPDDALTKTMAEIHRVSNRFILAMEYFNPTSETIQYRGHDDLLFKRDYGSIYLDNFPDLKVLDYGFFWKREEPTQDNTTWWLFEKIQ